MQDILVQFRTATPGLQCIDIQEEIKGRRLRLLGHVLRMENNRTPKTALRWTPPGRRSRGRPKTTWRRAEGEAVKIAKNREEWKRIVRAALCSTRDKED